MVESVRFKVEIVNNTNLTKSDFRLEGDWSLNGLFFYNMNENKRFGFETLQVWQEAKKITVEIYKQTNHWPTKEKYGLISQVCRASVSISANIAEGSARFSPKEQNRFYEVAFGSAIELMSHLFIAEELGYINQDSLVKFKLKIKTITKMISGLKRHERNQLSTLNLQQSQANYE